MNFTHKKIGIWGLGIVGSSALNYLSDNFECNLSTMDLKIPNDELNFFLKNKNISFFLQTECENFFALNDFIIASAGIDLRPYAKHQDKFISELDLFYTLWKKPIIAITGTLGKTSITHIIGNVLNQNNIKAAIGGNIGTGLLDLLQQSDAECAVLELSSFQLERAQQFNADLAIWTNFFPNHLDRHGSCDLYFDAKFNLVQSQKDHQQALIPFELAEIIRTKKNYSGRPLNFFSEKSPHSFEADWLSTNDTFFYFDSYNNIIKKTINGNTLLLENAQIPQNSYPINWLIVAAAMHLLAHSVQTFFATIHSIKLPEHRLECVATIRNSVFYNDSKSTVMEATLAAVNKLCGQKIILFLGGVSKGVDRSSSIAQLKERVHSIVCFGKESTDLQNMCVHNKIKAQAYETLDEAFESIISQIKDPCAVLFSPGGASFDLFKDYKERGERFKELVKKFSEKNIH